MKKKLIIINGTMGVGKTATCKELNKMLKNSVWLDGDWCWMINPFMVNEENKEMVINNITYLLGNFLKNSTIEYIIFNWVMHVEEIFDEVLKPLSDFDFETIKITLICSEEALKKRILNDVKSNLREESSIGRSIERLEMYENMSTEKIETSNLEISQTVDKIISIVKKQA